MPALKQITCNLKWTGSGRTLSEHQTIYGDGYVQTYVAVPKVPTPFSIHLKSDGYIAPGIAMFVYIDGEYQCNRNRCNLRLPDEDMLKKYFEVEFIVRQKETLLPDGSFWGRQWKFDKVDAASHPLGDHNRGAAPVAMYSGIIEVVVLRCLPVGEGLKKKVLKAPKRAKALTNSWPQARSPKGGPRKDADSSTFSSSEDNTDAMLDGGIFDGQEEGVETGDDGPVFGGGDASLDGHPQMPHTGQQQIARPSRSNTGEIKSSGQEINYTKAAHQRNSRNDTQHSWAQSVEPFRNQSGLQIQLSGGLGSSGNVTSLSDQAQTSPAAQVSHRAQSDSIWGHNPEIAPGTPAVIINVTQPGSWNGNTTRSVRSGSDTWAPHNVPYDNEIQESNGKTKNVWHSHTSWDSSNNAGQQQPTKDPGAPNDGQTPPVWSAVNPRDINSPLNNEWKHNAPQSTGTWDPARVKATNDSSQTRQHEDGLHEISSWTQHTDEVPKATGGQHWTQQSNVYQTQQSWPSGTANNAQKNVASPWGGGEKRNFHTENQRLGHQDEPTTVENDSGGDSANVGAWIDRTHESYSAGAATASPNGCADNVNTFQQISNSLPWSNEQVWPGTTNQQDNQLVEWNTSPDVATRDSPQTFPTIAAKTGERQTLPIDVVSRVKPYWQNWKQSQLGKGSSSFYGNLKESINAATEENRHVRDLPRQINAGRPVPYSHKTSSPKYMDTHENPYAVFVFNYRSQETLETMLNISVRETEDDEKQRLKDLSKDEIIEHFLRAQGEARKLSSVVGQRTNQTPGSFNQGGSSSSTQNNGDPAANAWASASDSHQRNSTSPDLNRISEKLSKLQSVGDHRSNHNSPDPEQLWGRQEQRVVGDVGSYERPNIATGVGWSGNGNDTKDKSAGDSHVYGKPGTGNLKPMGEREGNQAMTSPGAGATWANNAQNSGDGGAVGSTGADWGGAEDVDNARQESQW